MGKFSREKGKRGERLFVSLCKENGFDGVRRSVQYCGKTGDAADLTGLPGIHVECKFVERLNVREAMEQATHDAEESGKGGLPIVAHKKSNDGWLVTMRAEDWFRIYREYEAGFDL
mgnify:FL=1